MMKKNNNIIQLQLQANLLNLYNLLYNKESRHNPQPLSESSDSVMAKLIKDKISKIEKITTSSGLLETTWYTELATATNNYLYAPQNHPHDEQDGYHRHSINDDTEGHTGNGVIVIDIW